MFGRTDDPIRDFLNYDAEDYDLLQRRPKCRHCKEHIEDEWCYEIDGTLVCPECLVEHHRKRTVMYVRHKEDYDEII